MTDLYKSDVYVTPSTPVPVHYVDLKTNRPNLVMLTVDSRVLEQALAALVAVNANCHYNQAGQWTAKPLVARAIEELTGWLKPWPFPTGKKEQNEIDGTGGQELRDIQERQD
jgi:hypothetical protein